MKKSISASLIALSLITNLYAAETSNSEVKATVNKECIALSVTQNVNFGNNINPLETQTNIYPWAEDGSLAGVVRTYWNCSKGTPISYIQISANNWNLKTSDGEAIPYYFYNQNHDTVNAGEGTLKGNGFGIKIAINPSIKPGHYTDVITTTFTW